MGNSGFLVPGKIGPVAFCAAASSDWWLASNTIAIINVLEHVENPEQAQLYSGGVAADAWSVSFRTNLETTTTAIIIYAFDAQTGRVAIGLGTGTAGGVNTGTWSANPFAPGDHTYFFVSDGGAIQCYRDNSPIGSAASSTNNIGGAVRWRSHNNGTSSVWPVAIRAGHVANVALDATQRAALHAAMMALA